MRERQLNFSPCALIDSVLATLIWDLGPRLIVSAWLTYMLFVSAAR